MKKIKDRKLRRRLKDVILKVKAAKKLKDIGGLQKMRGYEPFYRIKLGDYRIGLEIANDKVIFVRFLHRKEIYRYFPR